MTIISRTERPSGKSEVASNLAVWNHGGMRRTAGTLPGLLAILVVASASAAANELTGYVAVTSDYVKRGVTQSDSDPALQLGIDLSFASGFYIGAWGSTMDFDNGPSRRRDSEVNYYAGYAYDVSDVWRLSGSIVAYRYPGQTGNVDYDYQEFSVGVSFDDRLWLEYSYSPDLYNTNLSSENVDLYAEWPVNRTWAIGGGGGYYDTSNLTGSAYWYWQLGATTSFKILDIDFRFHDTNRWVPVISAPDRADARVVLTIRIPF